MKQKVNNAFYDTLDQSWWDGTDHPIALLRAENRVRNPWIAKVIGELSNNKTTVLDIGCGGGLLTSYLSHQGHKVTGLDLSLGSLETARKQDPEHKITYVLGSAMELPFEDKCFDVVAAMDLLEHVPDYKLVIKEASRVLKPGGIFFFHTFNRNPISYLMIIKGVEWFVKNTPPSMHTYQEFIKPKELHEQLCCHHLLPQFTCGLIPDMTSSSFWKMLFTRKVDDHFKFKFVKNTLTGYVGYAKKNS